MHSVQFCGGLAMSQHGERTLQLRDLRHAVCTEMAETLFPGSTMKPAKGAAAPSIQRSNYAVALRFAGCYFRRL
jgi:hypothetical protein